MMDSELFSGLHSEKSWWIRSGYDAKARNSWATGCKLSNKLSKWYHEYRVLKLKQEMCRIGMLSFQNLGKEGLASYCSKLREWPAFVSKTMINISIVYILTDSLSIANYNLPSLLPSHFRLVIKYYLYRSKVLHSKCIHHKENPTITILFFQFSWKFCEILVFTSF